MASSPVEPELLTPRSKIRALLATLDSDDEANSPNKAGTAADEPESRPRGKLASRMQGASGAVQGGPNRSEATVGNEVGELAETDRQVNDGEDEEEDDDLPVMSRRFKRRLATAPMDDDTELPARTPSPGLFVSSPPRPSPRNDDSDSDADLPAVASDRFTALLQRKKQERLAREAESRARSEQAALNVESEGEESGITDDEGGRRLTQKARPARKASKKAIEEMNRETQRMARNMQLAHEAKTRKKLSTASLFERFNYRPKNAGPQTNSSSRPASPQSDVEVRRTVTPPSSPPARKSPETRAHMDQSDDDELPSVEKIADEPPRDKGKDKAVATTTTTKDTTKRRVRVRLPAATLMNTSDDELQIIYTSKNAVDAVLDKLPVHKKQESRPLRALRALAQVKSPGKQKHMTAGELDAQLQRRAREQAKLERERRLEALKAQGVVVQTAEERERQEQQVEDLVARARDEANKLRQMERAAAEDGDDDDSDEDGDFGDAVQEADGDASDLDLSGSEEGEEPEGEEEEEEEEDEENGEQQEADDCEQSADETVINPFLDRDAESEDEEDMKQTPVAGHRRHRRHKTVLSDDEAEVKATPRPKMTDEKTTSPACPTSVLRSAKKTFIPGLAVQGPAGLGLTQMFAGTMGEEVEGGEPTTQSMMPDFDTFPDSNFSATAADEEMIMDSQPEVTASLNVRLNLSQSQMHGFDSFPTQASDMTMEPTQDVGLQVQTPIKERFVEKQQQQQQQQQQPESTMDTEPAQSPPVRRGRLRRKADTDAFSLLVKGGRKQKRELDRKKTKARDMVEEQAQESEDEYAGLGGADGEDSDDESTASLQEIIDDNHEDTGDESKLAAFYADRARAEDEKQVEKLFKDITTGMLRRKRNTGYNLQDSSSDDDNGSARRRMKRRKFATMQKTLYADERVRKIANDVENLAFLRTLHDQLDDDDDDEMDIFVGETFEKDEDLRNDSSHGEEKRIKMKMKKRKRRLRDQPVLPGEVRETLSNLLDEDDVASKEASENEEEQEQDEEEEEEEEEEERKNLESKPIIKTKTIKNPPLEFPTQIKVPTLLRRATTNSSLLTSTSATSTTSTTFPNQDQTKIRRVPVRASVNTTTLSSVHNHKTPSRERKKKKVQDLATKRIRVVGAFLGRGVFE